MFMRLITLSRCVATEGPAGEKKRWKQNIIESFICCGYFWRALNSIVPTYSNFARANVNDNLINKSPPLFNVRCIAANASIWRQAVNTLGAQQIHMFGERGANGVFNFTSDHWREYHVIILRRSSFYREPRKRVAKYNFKTINQISYLRIWSSKKVKHSCFTRLANKV